MATDAESAPWTLKEIEELEKEIVTIRSRIEHPNIKLRSEAAIVVAVVNIRTKIVELGQKLDLAIKLGIDPNRTEVLRLRANFGHYWNN